MVGPASTRQGGREKVSGMKRLGLNIVDTYIYTYIERTRIEADYARELAKSWRKFDHEACPYFDHSYFDRIMRRRFFFRDPSRRYVEFAPTFVTIGFTDLLVRLRVRVLAINGSRLYRVT